MKKNYYFLIAMSFLFLLSSCNNNTKNSDLLEIPIDIHQNSSMPLSEITEELTAIELEFTNESIINPNSIVRVFIVEDEVIITELNKILVFNKDGKYVRSIGSYGQGPEEYMNISNVAIDLKNKRLFVYANQNFLCYDLNGKCLKKVNRQFMSSLLTLANDMNYINDNLLLVGDLFSADFRETTKEIAIKSIVYQLNDDFHILDSCFIRTINLEKIYSSVHSKIGYIFNGSKSAYLYYGDFFIINRDNLEKKQLYDTLYRFENNHLVPELKLKYKNNKINKFINVYNIYRSSRYIFAMYGIGNNLKNPYYFCYDTKTGKRYNMPDGYSDDINRIEKPIEIRPLSTDSEMFYYLHTNMKSDDLEEPNPTLYIGKLKK